jgi:hypothetical protein
MAARPYGIQDARRPDRNISCPKGQKLELASASYTGVTLTDATNAITVSLGDFSSGCLLPNVRGRADQRPPLPKGHPGPRQSRLEVHDRSQGPAGPPGTVAQVAAMLV